MITRYHQDVALILRIMCKHPEYSFGQIQDALREVDESNVRIEKIKEYKSLDTKKGPIH